MSQISETASPYSTLFERNIESVHSQPSKVSLRSRILRFFSTFPHSSAHECCRVLGLNYKKHGNYANKLKSQLLTGKIFSENGSKSHNGKSFTNALPVHTEVSMGPSKNEVYSIETIRDNDTPVAFSGASETQTSPYGAKEDGKNICDILEQCRRPVCVHDVHLLVFVQGSFLAAEGWDPVTWNGGVYRQKRISEDGFNLNFRVYANNHICVIVCVPKPGADYQFFEAIGICICDHIRRFTGVFVGLRDLEVTCLGVNLDSEGDFLRLDGLSVTSYYEVLEILIRLYSYGKDGRKYTRFEVHGSPERAFSAFDAILNLMHEGTQVFTIPHSSKMVSMPSRRIYELERRLAQTNMKSQQNDGIPESDRWACPYGLSEALPECLTRDCQTDCLLVRSATHEANSISEQRMTQRRA